MSKFSKRTHSNIHFFCYTFSEQYSSLLYMQKAVVVSSFCPFYQEFSSILPMLHSAVMDNKLKEPLEATLVSLVYRLRAPTFGLYSVEYKFEGWTNEFKLNEMNKIPKSHGDILILFQHLQPKGLFELMSCILLEVPIFIFCKCKYNLCCMIESLRTVILPFKIQCPVIALLPCSYYRLVEQMDNFIIGVPQKYSDKFFANAGIVIKSRRYVVVDFSEDERTKKINATINYKNKENVTLHLDDLPIQDTLPDNNSSSAVSNCNDGSSSLSSELITEENLIINQINTISEKTTKNKESGGEEISGIIAPAYTQSLTGSFLDVPLKIPYPKSLMYKERKISMEMIYRKKFSTVNDTSPIFLPTHYTGKVEKILNDYLAKTKKRALPRDVINNELNYNLYYYFVSVFLQYRAYLVTDPAELISLHPKVANGSITVKELFKVDEYIKKVDENDKKFFATFFDTKIWLSFLIKVLYPQTIEDKYEILLFDEMIAMKDNKRLGKLIKSTTPLLDTDIFKHNKKIILEHIAFTSVPSEHCQDEQTQGFPQLDYEVLAKLEDEALAHDKFIEKSQLQIIENTQDISEELNKLCIAYLNEKNSNLIYKNTPEYDLKLYDQIKFNQVHYLYKLWFYLFCVSFWYVDKNEKWIRFNQMKLVHNKMSTLTNKHSVLDKPLCYLLADTINKHGDKEMMRQLYDYLPYKDYSVLTMMNSKLSRAEGELPKYEYFKQRRYNLMQGAKEDNYDVNFDYTCSKCSSRTDMMKYVMDYAGKDSNDIYPYGVCSGCGNAKVQVKMHVVYASNKSVEMNVFTTHYLYKYFEGCRKYEPKVVHNKYRDVFYNCILYFQCEELFYDFLFPYKENAKTSYECELLQQDRCHSLEMVSLC